MKLSIIIPHCNEYQNLFMTIQNIAMQIENDPQLEGRAEIIVVDNLSDDIDVKSVEDKQNRPKSIRILHRKNVTEFLPQRYLSKRGVLRVIEYTDDQSLLKARQAGLDVAHGEYIVFSDAHVLHAPYAFSRGVQTMERHPDIGELHGAHRYFFDGVDASLYQYELTLEEDFWGKWTTSAPNYVDATTPFKIPMSSQATVFYRNTDLEFWGRAPNRIGVYGGDESLMSMRTWMSGKEVWCDPSIKYYHLSDIRGYDFANRDFVKNTLLVAFLLGGEEWLYKLCDRYRKSYAPEYQVELDWALGVCLSSRDEREQIMKKAEHTLDDVLAREPWSIPPTSAPANAG